MPGISPIICFLVLISSVNAQKQSFNRLLTDSSMVNASVSFVVRDGENGKNIFQYDAEKSLSQTSVMRLITSAAAIELLGPDHIFTTTIGYTGKIRKGNGTLKGDIIIRGAVILRLVLKDFQTTTEISGSILIPFLRQGKRELLKTISLIRFLNLPCVQKADRFSGSEAMPASSLQNQERISYSA